MTTDTVGGVWTYTRELVSGLTRHGARVTLASFGAMPRPEQLSWMETLENLDYRPTGYKLEWMQNSQRDIQESRSYLAGLIAEVKPDLLHSNQYCFGNLGIELPCIVAAHSDVVSWWVGVHGDEPQDEPWIRWYRQTVTAGLRAADVVVAPSQFMLDCVRKYYCRPNVGAVIYNGRSPELFDSNRKKDNFVLTVGRLWDQAKQVGLLLEREQSVPICLVGCKLDPSSGEASLQSSGEKPQEQLRELFADASVYAATSCYEPFGLAPLEAALSRCAIVANDIPSLREVWGNTVCYFRSNDSADLAAKIKVLVDNPAERSKYADRAYLHAVANYTAKQMVNHYEALYDSVGERERVA